MAVGLKTQKTGVSPNECMEGLRVPQRVSVSGLFTVSEPRP